MHYFPYINKIENENCQKAINALAQMLYYKVIPDLTEGVILYKLFNSKEDINLFCIGEDVDAIAMEWLIKSLRSEGFITGEFPIMITPLEVKKLCQR